MLVDQPRSNNEHSRARRVLREQGRVAYAAEGLVMVEPASELCEKVFGVPVTAMSLSLMNIIEANALPVD